MHVFSKTNHNDSLLLLVLREYFPWVLTTEQEHGLSSCFKILQSANPSGFVVGLFATLPTLLRSFLSRFMMNVTPFQKWCAVAHSY